MRIGVTGHMDLTPGTVPLVRDAITDILATQSGTITGVSCIARGADAVFAQAVLDVGGDLEVVVPSRDYRKTKVNPADADQFDALLNQAATVRVMDFASAGRAAYEAANEHILSTCDLLIAVWDGEGLAPGGQGGTAATVELAQGRIPVEVVWPEGSSRGPSRHMSESTTDHDTRWMTRAIELAYLCPKVEGAFAVGAVIVADGLEIATGYSRETDPKIHAEESALAKLGNDPRLKSATIYSTLEPCSQRSSSPTPCTDLILQAEIRRVVIAWREPSTFVENCVGVEKLQESGVEVVELVELADAAMEPNRHLDLS